jgi:hypothetical protein
MFSKWAESGAFFYTPNHPRLDVVEAILRSVLSLQCAIKLPENISNFSTDPLKEFGVSPQMNCVRRSSALEDRNHVRSNGGNLFTCREYITRCYDLLKEFDDSVKYNENENKRFDRALAELRKLPRRTQIVNPYKSRPDSAYWGRAVARPAVKDVSPVGDISTRIERSTRVATAGSCFAQHVARAMQSDGLNYYVAEPAPEGMTASQAEAQTYGLFSERYGNIYTSRQLLQLMKRAYGEFSPIETAWPVDGGFVDPFRPNIGEVFSSRSEVAASRDAHLGKVREMFETLDVFIFTMGLTETWVDQRDGAAFPVAPGAVTSQLDPAPYGFVNLDYPAVKQDMIEFIERLGARNPSADIILTVSPVPLIATYEETDVLSATTYSKSVLRAVAGDLATAFETVSYFPSYEIITGGYNRGRYFEDDLRSVRPEGVNHVMRVFRDRLVLGADKASPDIVEVDEDYEAEYQRKLDIVCDEEMLTR